ncbi:hypothetical protein [Asticcacaulis sp. AND118]|uniref:hypothetical protein n=1 Tax=Asticcacaulis sp. AND118 TaxID=2840468 RepID=UPI001CFFE004|nr:hypothetical protein [Asticcacaulis sp. AND118]UDF05762.1 hypothetical protein LH365_18565 [Asticcacaulis sp. AND118]
MLADTDGSEIQSGGLALGIFKPGTWLDELVGFIAEQLPAWRDRPGRREAHAETVLTSQLCAHLNGVARKTPGWDNLQFRVEEPDETVRSRRIDLVPAPAGDVIWVDGRRHDDFDTLLPIECKRLPTPKAAHRDKREYLRTSGSTTGGIQRFKAGLHGAGHSRALMIGYVQSGDLAYWVQRLDRWIRAFVRSKLAGWTAADRLRLASLDVAAGHATLTSSHVRGGGLADIALQHLWIDMVGTDG